ncbi:MAG: hypothetical protein WAK31_24110 [Chthoniobacterales bacterium]
MELKLLKISALVVGTILLLIGTDAIAFPGPPPGPPPSMGPPAGGFMPPSVAGGGFRGGPGIGGGPGISRPPNFSNAPNISRPGPSRIGGLAPNGKLAGGGPKPHIPNITRPGSSRTGGLVPNSKLGGGGNNRLQLPSKIQSLPKGNGSVLPSIAQGKQPGPGPQGKGFPDLSGKGPGEPGNRAPEPLANQQFWENWSGQTQGKLAGFQANRAKDWNNISEFRNNRNVASSFNRPEWNDYKNNVQNYRDNRAIEVTDNTRNSLDNYFSSNWWKDYGGYSGRDYGNYWRYADKYGSYAEKYWWWGAATYATAATWLALDSAYDNSESYGNGSSGSYDYGNSGSHDSGRSRSYDYGVNVTYEGDDVYVDGKRVASAKEYSQQAVDLANTSKEQPPAPVPPEKGEQAQYLPLGVWAMVQEEKGDAYMFFQISIDKDGVVTGAYKNLLSGQVSPISGQVDKKTQRVAWKIGSNNTVIEAGLQNLTQDVASCLVHFDTDTTQTWLLVRLKDPDMPNATQSGSVADDSK